MEKIDGRKLHEHKLLEFRERAFKLMDYGVSNKKIAQELGVHEVTVSNWKRKGLKIEPKGRKVGEKKLLSRSMEQKIYHKLFDLSPFELDPSSAFWTKKLIIKMIKKKFRRDIPSSTLGDYLKSWNLNSDEVQKFKLKFIEDMGDKAYEGMKYKAKKDYVNILWIKVPHMPEKEKYTEHHHFIINNNTGLLMLDLYNSLDVVENFKNFLSKSTSSTKKRFFLIVDGLNESQYNEVHTYIQQAYKKQILRLIPVNLLIH
ncbi:hypothetical protein [Sulfurimonas sp.]|uniref:hypothetical protein n=1 Tax=Sulfurimonas sp. TaxID=2022749 RepID=UPI0035626C6D